MPVSLDFEQITAPFRVPVAKELRILSAALKSVGLRLAKRVRQAEALERATRGFPRIRFYNGAVTCWIDRAQHGLLRPPGPSPRFVDGLRAGGRRFVAGLTRPAESVREELLLPRMLGTVTDVIDAILSSIERFARPTPSMFDPRARRASDVFGQLALLSRTLIGNRGQLERLGAEFRRNAGLFARPPARTTPSGGAGSAGEGAAVPAEIGDTLPEALNRYTRYIMGGILILPILPQYLSVLGRAVTLAIKLWVLNLFERTVRGIFTLRQRVIVGLFEGLSHLVSRAMDFIQAAQFVILLNLNYYLRFGIHYGWQLLSNVSRFAADLSRMLRFWTLLIEGFRSLLEELMNFDLIGFAGRIIAKMLPAGVRGYFLGALPTLTIGQVVDFAADRARRLVREQLALLQDVVDIVLLPLPESWARPIRRKVHLFRQAVDPLLRPMRRWSLERLPIPYRAINFPNLFNTLFGSGLANLQRTLRDLGTGLQTSVREILGAGVDMLNATSAVFGRAALEAAGLGDAERYRTLARRGRRLAGFLFEDQLEVLRERLRRPPPELVRAFESALIHEGFNALGAAIPLYVGQMRRYWQEQVDEGVELTIDVTPVSRHKLARRTQLTRVRTRNLVIRAPSRPMNDALAGEVASAFRTAVGEAYQSGRERFEQLISS